MLRAVNELLVQVSADQNHLNRNFKTTVNSLAWSFSLYSSDTTYSMIIFCYCWWFIIFFKQLIFLIWFTLIQFIPLWISNSTILSISKTLAESTKRVTSLPRTLNNLANVMVPINPVKSYWLLWLWSSICGFLGGSVTIKPTEDEWDIIRQVLMKASSIVGLKRFLSPGEYEYIVKSSIC